MKRLKAALSAVLVGACAAAGGAGPADARVVCKDGYRVLNGKLLGTPYCQDLYLVQVGREFGVRVSAREILNNPNSKRELCQFIGWDIRVQHICEPVLPRRGPF
ncbi:MAG: hypothetical protein APF80_15285 [Alphaproteobacteria bacterium BRH_c36]|nr:MAG: hypothetical protein APF80_15285 [Alphaproteobacteria bacterium BRH_c36]